MASILLQIKVGFAHPQHSSPQLHIRLPAAANTHQTIFPLSICMYGSLYWDSLLPRYLPVCFISLYLLFCLWAKCEAHPDLPPTPSPCVPLPCFAFSVTPKLSQLDAIHLFICSLSLSLSLSGILPLSILWSGVSVSLFFFFKTKPFLKDYLFIYF